MEKLEQLRKEAEKAQNAFIYAKDGDNLQELYKAKEELNKKSREYAQEYYKGSGVLGNEI